MRVHKIFFFFLMPHDDHVIFSSSSTIKIIIFLFPLPLHLLLFFNWIPQAESQRSDQKWAKQGLAVRLTVPCLAFV
jgi:hypothetical protein